jgi:2'-5' RNA ligase
MARPERLRLFVAIDLPATWRASLAAQSQDLGRRVPGFGRWVQPDLMHLTLVFLGSQASAILPDVTHAIDDVAGATPPFTLSAGDLGSFGKPRSLRVIWRGVVDQPRGALERAYQHLARALQTAGIAFDGAPFRPHLTLGRARRESTAAMSEAMAQALRTPGEHVRAHLEPFRCAELVLIRSDLRPSGPVYAALHRSPLGAESTRVADSAPPG